MEFDKKMLVRKEYEMYPKLITKELSYYVYIEGFRIDHVSIGSINAYFYMKDGTRFKVKLEK